VTWVLQKEKRNFPDFDAWYGPWQAKLAADPTMRWLVAARNAIEKQGDLDTFSTARVQLLDSYLEPPVLEMDVNPLLSTRALANELESQTVPERVRTNGILVVERRWVVKELPEHELLDALAYAWGFLSEIISDAHVTLGLPPVTAHTLGPDGISEPVGVPGSVLRGRLPCMLASKEKRTVRVKLSSHEHLSIARAEHRISQPSDLEKAARRYGNDGLTFPKSPHDSLSDHIKFFAQMARNVLVTDGHHSHIAVLSGKNGARVVQIVSEDRSEKYLNAHVLVNDVAQTEADTIIMVGESWFAPFDPAHPERHAVDSPERQEALTVDGITAEGQEESVVIPFRRDGRNIVFEEEQHVTATESRSMFFDPVRRYWAAARDTK
jgi:hypothetical protein